MKQFLLIIFIILLAAVLRFYRLGSIPPSLDWDEVSLAYNAYSIIRTGNDEYGNAFPLLSIRSFNDYKPPMYVYSLIPALLIFGKTDFAIRLPSALAGTLTVLATYFLAKELLKSQKAAILTALLLTISPWHLQFSRIAFEANLALLFFVAGIFFLVKSFTRPIFLPLSAVTLSAAIFSYHSLRLLIPLLVLVILLPKLSWLKTNFKFTLSAALIAAVSLALLFRVISQGAGQARFKTVSFMTIPTLLNQGQARISTDNYSFISRIINHRFIAYLNQLAIGYTDHFSFNFWFIEGDANPRHRAADFGLLYLIELPFLVIGMIQMLRRRPKAAALIFPWFFLAPIASSLTSGTPSAVRSLFFLPTFQIFTALGLVQFVKLLKKQIYKLLFAFSFSLLAIVSVVVYADLYYRHSPQETAPAWQYGYQQMVQKVMAVKDQYDQVIVTPEYDQPYIYFLWYGNYDPKLWVNHGEFAKGFDNLKFRSINWDSDKDLPRTLLIGSPQEINTDQVLWQVNFPDNTPAFVAYET